MLRELYRLGSEWDNEHYLKEKKRQDKVVENYNRNKDKPKFKDKSNEWWFDTMGIDIDFIKSLEDK